MRMSLSPIPIFITSRLCYHIVREMARNWPLAMRQPGVAHAFFGKRRPWACRQGLLHAGPCRFLHFRHIFCLAPRKQMKYNENAAVCRYGCMAQEGKTRGRGVFLRQISRYCLESRIPPATITTAVWLAPKGAGKPVGKRGKWCDDHAQRW